MVEMLKLAGGECLLVSNETMGKDELSSVTKEEKNEEKEIFLRRVSSYGLMMCVTEHH